MFAPCQRIDGGRIGESPRVERLPTLLATGIGDSDSGVGIWPPNATAGPDDIRGARPRRTTRVLAIMQIRVTARAAPTATFLLRSRASVAAATKQNAKTGAYRVRSATTTPLGTIFETGKNANKETAFLPRSPRPLSDSPPPAECRAPRSIRQSARSTIRTRSHKLRRGSAQKSTA